MRSFPSRASRATVFSTMRVPAMSWFESLMVFAPSLSHSSAPCQTFEFIDAFTPSHEVGERWRSQKKKCDVSPIVRNPAPFSASNRKSLASPSCG